MGFFSFIGDLVQTVVFDPFNTTLGIAKDVFGSDIVKAGALIGAGAVIGGGTGAALGAAQATGIGLGGAPGPGLTIVAVPVPFQTTTAALQAPSPRGSVSGGAAAFSNFGFSPPGRGNPSWLFSGNSVRSSVAQGPSSVNSRGWRQVSPTSVRLLA